MYHLSTYQWKAVYACDGVVKASFPSTLLSMLLSRPKIESERKKVSQRYIVIREIWQESLPSAKQKHSEN